MRYSTSVIFYALYAFFEAREGSRRNPQKRRSIMSPDFFVAVHGSALHYVLRGKRGPKPRDIDVVRCGVSDEVARAAATAWASKNGLEKLPLDIVASGYVPFPPGRERLVLTLVGDNVTTRIIHTLPALLRGGGPAQEWAGRINGSWKLGIALGSCAHGDTFGEYCGEGPMALRNALRHVTPKQLKLLEGGLGEFLTRVKRAGELWEDPRFGPSVISLPAVEEIRQYSGGSYPNGAINFFSRGGEKWCGPHYWPANNQKTAMEWWDFITTP